MSFVDRLAHDGLLLRCLCDRPLLQTEEMALAAVRSCGAAYFYVAPELACLESVALAAVSRDGRVLQAVPSPTEAVCLAAVCQNYRAYRYVPESLRTPAVRHAYAYAYDAQVNRPVPVDSADVSAAFRFFYDADAVDDDLDEEDYDW